MAYANLCNLIANTLLAKGANKNAIIGVLCNMGAESGYDPHIWQGGYYQPGDWGFGLVQWTLTVFEDRSKVIAYAQNHTREESCKYQCDILYREYPDSWQDYHPTTGRDYNTCLGFWQNQFGLDPLHCTFDWLMHFERPKYNGWSIAQKRYNDWANFINDNVKWDGNIPGGGGEVVPPVDPKPEEPEPETPIRKLTLQECMAFIDKAKPQHNGEQQPDPIDPDKPPVTPPSGSSGNMQAVWDMYQQAVNAGLSYSWDLRNNFPYYGDCSSFVSRCVQTWLGLPINTGYNTETLHAYLKSIGYTCTYEGSRTGFPNSAPEGSVILMGRLGQSAGAGGHTVFVCDNNKTIEVSASAPPNQNYGISGIYSVDRLKNWHTSINYWYLYEKR